MIQKGTEIEGGLKIKMRLEGCRKRRGEKMGSAADEWEKI